MTREVQLIRTDQSIREAAQVLSHRRISGAPVVDEHGKLAGVISQADVAAHVAHTWAEQAGRDPARFYQSLWIKDAGEDHSGAQALVRDLMAPYIYFATEDATLDQAADMMLRHNIHRVVIVRGDQVVGIVTSLDLVRSYRQA